MLKSGLLAMALLGQPQQIEVAGEVASSQRKFDWVDIESMDRRFVKRADIDRKGRFVFKRIPEGLYKLVIGSENGREEYRTVEVRSTLAAEGARIGVRIEIQASRPSEDEFVIGIGAFGVSPKAVDQLRRAYEVRGNAMKARMHLEKALEISPHFVGALNNLGTIYHGEGDFEKARGLFERALVSNPHSFEARINLAGTMSCLGEHARALDESLIALRLRPDDSVAHSQAGKSFFMLKRYDDALRHLKRAREIDPFSFTFPELFIAKIREIQGDNNGAISEYREFLRIHPGPESAALAEPHLRNLEGRIETSSAQ